MRSLSVGLLKSHQRVSLVPQERFCSLHHSTYNKSSHICVEDKFRSSDAKGISETIFNLFRDAETNTINIGHLFSVVELSGIRRSDPRLKNLLQKVTSYHELNSHHFNTLENLYLDEKTFTRLTADDLVVLSQAVRNDVIIPDFPAFCVQLKEVFHRCTANTNGSPASYIPQLERYDPNLWAMSICTVDGQRFSLGDVDQLFTMQSCSKPFTYAMCLNELGNEIVHNYIGQEPSGRNFNEICLDKNNMPHNPMLNAGAMMSAALILNMIEPRDQSLAEKYEYTLNYMRRLAGSQNIGFNNSVFLSERATADRNFAMAYYMREYNCFPSGVDIHTCLDLYFQGCSMEVDTEALSVMGATLANGGICPTTGEKVLKPEAVRDVLSLMYSCGMYNYSGQFAFKVGLPAKSGVSGCIMLVIPNLMCVALWSPRLDEIGNSVRGVQFCDELVSMFNFHRFDNLKHSEKKLDPRRESHELRSLTTLTLLFSAVAGDVASLHRHYLQGVDMTTCDYDGRTALHLAAAEGHEQAVKFLLDTCKVPHHPKDRWDHTPESEAARFGHENILEILSKYT